MTRFGAPMRRVLIAAAAILIGSWRMDRRSRAARLHGGRDREQLSRWENEGGALR